MHCQWCRLRLAVSTEAAQEAATAQKFCSRYGLDLVQGLGIMELDLPILKFADA